MSKTKLNLGKFGEEKAVFYLKSQGYKILERNFKKRYGEIDIIALDKETLVFVEVKTRWSQEYGPPEEAITFWKLKSLIKTGQFYKMLHPELPEALRIDLVAIELSLAREVKRIELIKNITD